MRKILLLAGILISGILTGNAQKTLSGMKYQAVARDYAGEVLANRSITIRIDLHSDAKNGKLLYYSEEHSVTTNKLGLFDLVVGEGRSIGKGSFADIPWSTEDIWMTVSLKDKGVDFTAVSESRLLAVPYAFYAGSAGKLTIGKGEGNTPGVPANVWSLQGNYNSDPTKDKLGTTDNKDLVLVTNNLERLRITANGDINIANSLKVGVDVEVGNDLYVKKNVYLNTVSGATVNNGSFTVANMSPTSLTGTLTVDKDAWLKSKLRVDDVTDLNGALNVNNMSATTLTGTLRVDKDATFKEKVLIDNASLGSTSASTGGLVVAGGAGIGQNLYVGNSVDVTTNATIHGRAGIGTLYGNVRLNVTAPSTDAFPLNVEVSGTSNKFQVNSDGQVYLRSTKSGNSSNTGNYAMFVDGQDQGIIIRLNGKNYPDNDNHYMSFWGANNVLRGRIEGQTADELHNSFDYIWFQTMSGIDDALSIAMIAVDLAGVDDFDAAVVDGVEMAASIAEWAKQTIEMEDNLGVTYESGSGDYAEWLRKSNPTEDYSFGDIVAVTGGMISRNTAIADHYLVVSMSPIVLGNMPAKGKESEYEKIAFMGQVPVKVRGKVAIGDYIVPSGLNDGTGIAISKANMPMDQYKNIIGVAWSGGNSQEGYSLINVAIGITTNALADKISSQEKEIIALKKNLNSLGAYLASKDPSFKMDEFAIETPKAAITNDQPVKEAVDVKSFDRAKVKEMLMKNKSFISSVLANAKKNLDERNINVSKYPKLERLLTDTDYFIQSIGKEPASFK